MAILVIGYPEEMPPELAENPDVVVVDAATLDPELMEQLVTAAGGMIEDADGEQDGGEGALQDWAGEEEREHGMGDPEDEEQRAGMGDDEEQRAGMGDDEEEQRAGMGYGDPEDEEQRAGMGYGEEEEERRPLPPPQGKGRGGKGPKFSMSISGRGAAVPALSKWASSFGNPGR